MESVILVEGRKRRMIYYYPIYFIMLFIIRPGVGLAYSQTQAPNPLENKKVLILNAFEANIPAFEKTDHGLSITLQSGGIPIKNQFYEHLDLRRHPSRNTVNSWWNSCVSAMERKKSI